MPGVLVGYCSPLTVNTRFVNCLTELIDHDKANHQHIAGKVALLSGPRIAEARSQIVDAFLAHETNPDWLLMLDSDMTFDVNIVERFVAAASTHAPVWGGLCFGGVHGHRIFPTVGRAYMDEGMWAMEWVDDYPRDDIVKVGATGAACLFVHRGVFGAMKRPGPKVGETFDPEIHGFGTFPDGRVNPYPWFVEGLVTKHGMPLGEDVAFCKRLAQLNVPIYVDTGIKLGHCKEWVINEASFDDYRRERDRPGPMLDALVEVARESGRFDPAELAQIKNYLRPRWSILSDTDRPKPQPFLLPEPVA